MHHQPFLLLYSVSGVQTPTQGRREAAKGLLGPLSPTLAVGLNPISRVQARGVGL